MIRFDLEKQVKRVYEKALKTHKEKNIDSRVMFKVASLMEDITMEQALLIRDYAKEIDKEWSKLEKLIIQ